MHWQDLLAIEQKRLGNQEIHADLIEIYKHIGDCYKAFRDNDTAWETYEKAVNCVALAKAEKSLDFIHLQLCESMQKVRPNSVLELKIKKLQEVVFEKNSIANTKI